MSTISTSMPTSASWLWTSWASFSDTGTPTICEKRTVRRWPSFSRTPSAPATQPFSSSSAIAAVGVVRAELTGVVDVERRVLDEDVVAQRLRRPRDAGEVGHADGGPVERHLDRLADDLVLDQATVGARVQRDVTPVRAGGGADLGARRVERQGVAVGVGTDVERVDLVVGERLRRGVGADHRELDRVEQRRGAPPRVARHQLDESGRRRRTCRPRTDR